MIKRTLYFGTPAFLHTKYEQLIIEKEGEDKRSIPIEDIGFIIIDNERISLSKTVMAKLLDNNAAVVITNSKHIPAGLMLPLEANTLQQERFSTQIDAALPLKKRLWQQTVRAKIRNQSLVLQKKGADTANIEALAARRYWKLLFTSIEFKRRPSGDPPNNLLNYGYAVMRAVIARSLIGAGLLPLIGIHHKNRYNAYPLADDIMEPFRPFVDELVHELVSEGEHYEIGTEEKQDLLELPQKTVNMNGERSPLMIAASHTAVSLYKCFSQENDTIQFPEPWT
ncbi:hypothetical protein AMJ80_10510 [bacterium SM23_31]|nr:MAG: hypothetical protein AMJ80_10510 [bacterium SM23_31]